MILRSIVLAATILCLGCSTQPSRELPADWPIAALTLDPAWELIRPATAMHTLDPAKYPEPMWLVAFDNKQDWPGVVAHVERCLKPLQYWRSKSHGEDNPLGLDLPETRTYYSPDYLTMVLVSNGAYFDELVRPDVEFALQITRYKTPPEPLGSALSLNRTRPGSGLADQILAELLEPIT
jgi:hypothetical protein